MHNNSIDYLEPSGRASLLANDANNIGIDVARLNFRQSLIPQVVHDRTAVPAVKINEIDKLPKIDRFFGPTYSSTRL